MPPKNSMFDWPLARMRFWDSPCESNFDESAPERRVGRPWSNEKQLSGGSMGAGEHQQLGDIRQSIAMLGQSGHAPISS